MRDEIILIFKSENSKSALRSFTSEKQKRTGEEEDDDQSTAHVGEQSYRNPARRYNGTSDHGRAVDAIGEVIPIHHDRAVSPPHSRAVRAISVPQGHIRRHREFDDADGESGRDCPDRTSPNGINPAVHRHGIVRHAR